MPATAAAGDAASGGGQSPEPSNGGSWVVWHTDHFFDSCDGNCGVAGFGGQQVRTRMADIIDHPSPPWDWKWGNSELIGGAFSRRVVTLWNVIDIEPELGVAKRVGSLHQEEVWGALYVRWIKFPWNDYLRTSIAVSTGLNYASLPGRDTPLLHYFAPEVTFALPEYRQYEFLIRFHHRSSIGLFTQVDPGWQYLTAGIRYRF